MNKRIAYSAFTLFPSMVAGAAMIVSATGCTKKTPDSSTVSGTASNSSAEAQSKLSQQKTVWTCPMHPQIKKDGPGSCPICGMDLVQVSQGGESKNGQHAHAGDSPEGHAAFDLSLERQQMIGVKTGDVEKKPLFKSIEAAGRVAFDPELYTAQNEYLEAIRQFARVQDSPLADVRHSAQRMVESAKLRLKVLGLSDRQIQQIGRTGTRGENLLLPQRGETLLVYAEVFEMDLPSIEPGLEAKISGGSLGSHQLTGKVVSVDRVINPATRTAKVRVQIPNAMAELRPEAFVDVTIRSPLGEQISVPFDAVLDTGKEAWVFVAQAPGRYEPRRVSIKFRADDQVAISSGVHPGERIVTSANFLIDSESRLKGVLLGDSSTEATGREEPAKTEEKASPKTPECPKGQFWHAEMKHCMPKVGG